MNITKQVIILSASRPEHSFEGNRQRTENLKAELEAAGISFREGVGFFQGSTEASFVTIIKDNSDYEKVIDLAFEKFDQDSILYQDANQEAYLVENTNETTRLGVLQEVTEKVATEKGAYTKLGDKFYTTISRI